MFVLFNRKYSRQRYISRSQSEHPGDWIMVEEEHKKRLEIRRSESTVKDDSSRHLEVCTAILYINLKYMVLLCRIFV